MDNCFAGIDVSTQSLKIIILDLKDNSVIYEDSVVYDNDLPKYHTINGTVGDKTQGISESDPFMWIDALNIVFKRASQDTSLLSNINALSVSGQQHGLVAIDKQGKLTRPTSKLWNDFSTQTECDILTEKIGGIDKMIKEIGNTQRTGYTAPKIFHMYRNEQSFYNETQTFLLVHNFINWYLTGGRIIMEPGDASGTGLWDPVKKVWSKNLLNIISKDLVEKLPTVGSSTKSIGTIAQYFVKKYGFDPECKIDAGSGDNMYSAIGTGNIKPGTVSVSLGTSGTAFTILERPYIDPSGEIACFCDSTGNYLPLLCISNMAGGYNAFLKENSLSHSDFEDLLSFTDPGNNGNIIVPWYDGERTPDMPDASPIYFGFSLENLNKKSIARAIIEGHILNLNEGFDRMPVRPKVLHLTGGLSLSKSWCQTIANIFNCQTVPVVGEGAALGAAIHAAWIWEKESGNEEIELVDLAQSFVKFDESLRSDPESDYAQTYENLRSLYKSVTRRIRGLESDDPFSKKRKFFK